LIELDVREGDNQPGGLLPRATGRPLKTLDPTGVSDHSMGVEAVW